jgi:hypothetical protein
LTVSSVACHSQKEKSHFTSLELKEKLSATVEVGDQVSEFVNPQSNWINTWQTTVDIKIHTYVLAILQDI